MKFISHRGNTKGSSAYENKPDYVTSIIKQGIDVEVDIWYDNGLFLGHDEPIYPITTQFLKNTKGLWLHCKNIKALEFCKDKSLKHNYFWHQNDDFTLTSNGFIWTYPNKPLTKWSVAVLPEKNNFKDLSKAYAVCSDYLH